MSEKPSTDKVQTTSSILTVIAVVHQTNKERKATNKRTADLETQRESVFTIDTSKIISTNKSRNLHKNKTLCVATEC